MLTIDKVINDLNKTIKEYTFVNKSNDDEKVVKAYMALKKCKCARENMRKTPTYLQNKITNAAEVIVKNVLMTPTHL